MAQHSGELRQSQVHRAVIGKRRILNVPYSWTVMNFTIFIAIAWISREWPIAAVGIVNFWILRQVFKNDPSAFEVYYRHLGQGTHYEPWPQARSGGKDKRPINAGRSEAW